MSTESKPQAVLSKSDVARLVGLSRQRFHQLVKRGVFPEPLYDVQTRRPFYTEEMAAQCEEVRQRNTGINGQVVLFYACRSGAASSPKNNSRPKQKKTNSKGHADLIDGLKALGLDNVTTTQVESAIRQAYPAGEVASDPTELLRAVFLVIKRQEQGG